MAGLLALLVKAGIPLDSQAGELGFFDAPPKAKRLGVAFISTSASDWAFYLTSGAKLAPFSGLDKPGFRLLYSLGTKFRERDPLVIGRFNRFAGGRIFLGHEWQIGALSISAYAGPSLSLHSPRERAVTRYEGRLGAAAMIEFWQSWNNHPTLRDGFTSGTLLVDAAEASGFLRLRHGFSTGWRNTAIGPEVSFSAGRQRSVGGVIGRDSWLKMRMGLHANGLTFGSFGLNGSAGYEWRRRERSSAYAEITALYHY
ncbi:MAG: cellulose biosynthesis protein BcsS [Methylobacterium sp.]|nr:cellulose biosynthesis protein BcsS [Methylobacterium sp.]